jgi:antitoxin FitA
MRKRISKMIQIRHVPDELHRKLKARAAMTGTSLSEYLLAELRACAARPTREEMLARLAARRSVTTKRGAADVIREERDRS